MSRGSHGICKLNSIGMFSFGIFVERVIFVERRAAGWLVSFYSMSDCMV